MGYALGHGRCFGCGRIFAFNPMRVPSIPIDGDRRPICQACVNMGLSLCGRGVARSN